MFACRGEITGWRHSSSLKVSYYLYLFLVEPEKTFVFDLRHLKFYYYKSYKYELLVDTSKLRKIDGFKTNNIPLDRYRLAVQFL